MVPTYFIGSLFVTGINYGLAAVLAFGVLFGVSFWEKYVLLYYGAGILFLTQFLAPLADAIIRWIPKGRVKPEGKAVFISGCGSGFGFKLAQRLDAIGFQVFAGCRCPDGEGALELRKSSSKRLHVVGLDVSSDFSVREAAAFVNENLGSNVLWAVVNNAGIGTTSSMLCTSTETMQRLLDVNTVGIIRLTRSLLPKLKEGKGRVVTVASLSGRMCWPLIVGYSISKTASIRFCEALRTELCGWNIPVITIEPSFFRTKMASDEYIRETVRREWEVAPQDIKNMYTEDHPEKVIKKYVRVLKRYAFKDISRVISAIEDAVTSLLPERTYIPAALIAHFVLYLSQKLPAPIFDLFVSYPFLYLRR